MPKISVIILAAGLSRRMGGLDKLFLPVAGKPMIHHVIDEIAKTDPFEILLVTNETSHDKVGEFENRILNPSAEEGMTSSIQTGIRATSREADGYMICLGDMPFIRAETFSKIIEEFATIRRPGIVVPYYQGQKGNPVIFSADFRDEILGCQEKEGCRSVIKKNSHLVHKIQLDDHSILKDIDTMQMYQKHISQ